MNMGTNNNDLRRKCFDWSPRLGTRDKNQRGMATIESLPLLVIFSVLMSYGMGLFGAVHTGILQSIAARTYAFETFRNRTNLTLFRENLSGLSDPLQTQLFGIRFHAVLTEIPSPQSEFFASERPLAVGRNVAQTGREFNVHNQNVFNGIGLRNETVEVSPIWIMVGYGICLSAACGDN